MTTINPPALFQFRLYVAGNAPTGAQAISNLTALCREYLPDRHQTEIVDVMRYPNRAIADGVLMTPTLLKIAPKPVCRIVGALSQKLIVLHALGLEPAGA